MYIRKVIMKKKFLLCMPQEIYDYIKEQSAFENKTMSLYIIESVLQKAEECAYYLPKDIRHDR